MSTATQTGIVKWFDDGKGFGFITPEGAVARTFSRITPRSATTVASAACRKTSASNSK